MRRRATLLGLLLACSSQGELSEDAAVRDTGPDALDTDVGVEPDSGVADSGVADSGTDSGAMDVGVDEGTGDAESDAPAASEPFDLGPYWIAPGIEQTFRRSNGDVFGWYRFTEDSGGYAALYTDFLDQGTPGRLVSWEKTYPFGEGGRRTATTGLLWFADDGSVTEVGDWYNSTLCGDGDAFVAFGYQALDSSTPLGLIWSPPGGVRSEPSPEVEVRVLRQTCPGDAYVYNRFDAHSSVALIAHHETWQAPYGMDEGVWRAGAGRVYRDVIQLVLFHGTRSPDIKSGAVAPVRCGEELDSTYERAGLYRSFSNYETYAIEAYLARGVGYVHETVLFTESAGLAGGDNVCRGAIMGFEHEAAEAAWSWTLE